MTNFFYTDARGQKLGPYNDGQLKALAAQGFITPQTVLETDTGHKGQAGQIPGIFNAPPLHQPVPNQYQQSVQYQDTDEGNGKATVGKILGWIAVFAWLIPIVGLPVSITGLVFSIKGDTGLGKTLNIIGLILSIINGIIGAFIQLENVYDWF